METKKKRKFYRGNLREYRGNLREYRGNLQTDVSTILKPTFQACVAMAQEFQEPSSLFFFHGTNSPNPWCPDLSKNEAVGAAIGQNHLSHFYCFIAVFVFHRVFSNQNGPSRFFLAFGFRRHLNILVLGTQGMKWHAHGATRHSKWHAPFEVA